MTPLAVALVLSARASAIHALRLDLGMLVAGALVALALIMIAASPRPPIERRRRWRRTRRTW